MRKYILVLVELSRCVATPYTVVLYVGISLAQDDDNMCILYKQYGNSLSNVVEQNFSMCFYFNSLKWRFGGKELVEETFKVFKMHILILANIHNMLHVCAVYTEKIVCNLNVWSSSSVAALQYLSLKL